MAFRSEMGPQISIDLVARIEQCMTGIRIPEYLVYYTHINHFLCLSLMYTDSYHPSTYPQYGLYSQYPSPTSSQHSISPSPFDYVQLESPFVQTQPNHQYQVPHHAFQQPQQIIQPPYPQDSVALQSLPKTRPQKTTRQIQISHPYARLFAKKDEVKRRKIWNHALEKSLFNPFEL